jgi:predicted transposase/invertase (TIGR01784 family)
MKNKLTKPHDHFTKKVLGKLENAKSFVENYMPKELVSEIDLNSLKVESETFIDSKLKDKYSDILYSFDLDGKKAGIYILIEHKSYYNKNTLRQILQYMCRIWEKEDKYVIILPILLYHGDDKIIYGSQFEDMFKLENKKYLKYIPKFEIIVKKLNKVHKLLGTEELKFYIFLLKCRDNPEMLKNIKTVLILNKLSDNMIEAGLTYIVSVMDEKHQEKFINEINNSTIGKDKMVSIAQAWERKGRLKGKRLGELRNKIQMAKRMLQKRLNLNLISEITGLSVERIKQLQ